VVYVSLHEWPAYPWTGLLEERGAGRGLGATLNIPMPATADGDAYRAGLDVVADLAGQLEPTWVLLSAGFDGHRDDPLTNLGLTAGDYADLTDRVAALAPAGRRIAFLEGGYDLRALHDSAGACVAALAGVDWRPERVSSGGTGREAVEAAERELAANPLR
jgi:acetoin utilization deacetylase AcuC-like enzyme